MDILPKYQPVLQEHMNFIGEEDSSSDNGLIEKDIQLPRRRLSFIRKYGRLIVLQALVLLLYTAILLSVVEVVRIRFIKFLGGPGVIYCEPSFFT